MAVFGCRAPCFSGRSGSLLTPLFQACTGGVSACLSFQSVSVERRFEKLDLNPEQLVFDYQPADAVGASKPFPWFECGGGIDGPTRTAFEGCGLPPFVTLFLTMLECLCF
jgi:hypothetical protein